MISLEKKDRTLIENLMMIMLFIALIYAAYQTIGPFLGIFTFALIFSVSFSGLFNKLTKMLGGKRKLASIIYGGVLLLVVAGPLVYFIIELIGYVQEGKAMLARIKAHDIRPLPEWIGTLPMVGPRISAFWAEMQADPESFIKVHEAQISSFLQRLATTGGGIIGAGLQICLGVIVSAVLLFHGQHSLVPLRKLLGQLTDPSKGETLIQATGRAITGVSGGVLGTAFLEAILAFIGFKIAGVDLAGGLAALVFFFALVQLGPVLVMIPAIIWTAKTGSNSWAIFLGAWTVLLVIVDNVVKPILMGRSGKLPILILFVGVIGGMAAWGFTGMFKGAVVLAIVYTLFTSWDIHSAKTPSTPPLPEQP